MAFTDDDRKDLEQLHEAITNELASSTRAWVCVSLLRYGHLVRHECLVNTNKYLVQCCSRAITAEDLGNNHTAAAKLFEYMGRLRAELAEIERLRQNFYLPATM